MIEELNDIKLRLNSIASNIKDVNNLTLEERDAILGVEVDIFIYLLKNEVKIRKDIGYFSSILSHIRNKMNRSHVPNNKKIEKLNAVIDRICIRFNWL